MKSVDRRLQLDVKAYTRKQKQATFKKPTTTTKAHSSKKNKKRYILSDDDEAAAAAAAAETESGFHFIAYVPAHNHLWRMDGLEREPESLGTFAAGDGSNWLDMEVVELGAQLQSAAVKNIEFSLLSLVAAREDWGPALAELVRLVAERGLDGR